jgi:hypothetical protein
LHNQKSTRPRIGQGAGEAGRAEKNHCGCEAGRIGQQRRFEPGGLSAPRFRLYARGRICEKRAETSARPIRAGRLSFEARMKTFLLQFFTWWNGQTLGTRIFTWRKGEKVGTDEFGNTYYRTRGGAKDPALGHERRWVIYKGEADASKIPPGWYGWMHHRFDTTPVQED